MRGGSTGYRAMVAFVAGLLLLSALLPQVAAGELKGDYGRIVRQCLNDPEYRIGGAATGDCLEAQSLKLEAGIEALVRESTAAMCPQPALLMQQAQQQWRSYRDDFCQVFPALFDNTAMYVNSQACVLRLTLSRRDDLVYLKKYSPGMPKACE